jgi:hypothetical protein
MRTVRALSFLALSLTAPILAGCGAAETAFDCQQICSRYQTCYDPSYDVGACRDRCRAKAENDPTVMSEAAKCDDCIGDKSCISATFNCATECGALVGP